VHELTAKLAGPIPGAAGGMTRLAYARAKQAGIALKPLLRTAGLKESQVEDAGARLGVRNQIAFLNLVAEALPDAFLGFHLAQPPDLREIGLLYYVAASSATLDDALQRAGRYASLVNEGIAMEYAAGGAAAMRFNYLGVARHSDRHQIEFTVTILVRLCRALAAKRLQPLRVRFTHRRAEDPSEINSFFGCETEFGAEVDEVVFDGAIARLPVIGADPYLNKLLVAHFEEAVSRRPSIQGTFRASVENAITPLLPHGQARVGDVSRSLGMSPRTLARRLASEGVTFSGVVENLRSTLAEGYLKNQNLSISQIAWLLGYQEVSAFTHAFKRWTGKAPRVARSEQKASAGGS
jgi:AraC-like DNA-binding protein